ncbi:tyrosine-type recombinase/integrase [Rhodopirellula europaea]|uniref:tyrosine-type recombinase/integrase n=1 Tax=Rhodopirellula europaea TaxID=1263866 RepID=UPI0030EC350B
MHYHTPTPFFRKSRNRWYVQINGRQVNLGPDKEKAFARYHQLMSDAAAVRTPAPRADTPKSVAFLADHFLEWVERNRAPETYEWYRYRLQRFIDFYPTLSAAEIRPYHVERWVDRYKLSQTSRRNYFRSVKRCLKWATRQGYIDKDPLVQLEVPSGERREVYISPQDFTNLLDLVRNPDFRDLLVATYTTGCRPQELLRVQTRHVETSNRRWVFQPSEAKGKREPRIVYMSDEGQSITEQRLERNSSDSFLFQNSARRPWTTDAVNCAFNQVQQRMGQASAEAQNLKVAEAEIIAFTPTLKQTKRKNGQVRKKTERELYGEAKRKLTSRLHRSLAPRYSLYALRHSWATNALKRGLDALTVAILMGHRDPSTLARVYQHLGQNPEHMQEQARRAATEKRQSED